MKKPMRRRGWAGRTRSSKCGAAGGSFPSPAWAAEPIALGHPGATFVPLVLGPEWIPSVTDQVQARAAPELAVLSALAHGHEAQGAGIAFAALAALGGLDDARAALYYDLIVSTLDEVARRALEDLMIGGGYQYQSEFARKYFAQGEAEGRAEGRVEGRVEGLVAALQKILDARGLSASETEGRQILACAEVATLERWIERALTAGSIEAVLGA